MSNPNPTPPTEDHRNKPVTGYPAQPSTYNHPNNYHQPPPNAYPYTAPPPASYYTHQNPNPNPYPYPPPQPYATSYDPRRATFLRRLMIAMISVLLIFGAITLIVWLVLRPKLPEFRVESASVSSFNTSNSLLTANWDFGFAVRNPNKKMSISYDRIEAALSYREAFLTETNLAPFSQGKRNETTMRATFSTVSSYVDQWAVKNMAEDRSRGSVRFNLRMLAWVRFRTGAWVTRRHLMRVLCVDVNVGFSGAGVGTLNGGPRECRVYI